MEAVKRKETIFEDEQFTIARSNVEVGKIYPIYGMITKILEEKEQIVIVELNHQIKAQLKYASEEHLAVLKERVFEYGIFVSEVQSLEPEVKVECKKVIFGKRATQNA